MRARAVAGRGRHLRRILAQRTTEDIELTGQSVGSASQGSRELRLQYRSFGHLDMDQVIEPVVKQNLRIEHHDHVNTNEHLEHPLVQVEIDWAGCLIRRARPVKVGIFTFAPDCQFELKRAIPTPIIIDVVFK